MKKLLSVFVILNIISKINGQGWSESFNVNATPSSTDILTSDMSWSWWGWGTAEVAEGNLKLVGATSPFNSNANSCWLQIGQSVDSDAIIKPDSATTYLKVKFTTTGVPSNGDQLHIAVALDPLYLFNGNAYAVTSSAIGFIGDWYFNDAEPTSSIGYDSWFWKKIVVSNDTIICLDVC